MNRSRIFGFAIGVLLACTIVFFDPRTTQSNSAVVLSDKIAQPPETPPSRSFDRHVATPVARDRVGTRSNDFRTISAREGLLSEDPVATSKAEQRRFIGFAEPLEHNAKRLGHAMIALLREKDVERVMHDGHSASRQELLSEIETAAPIPTVPYGPKLGLVPNP